MPETFAALLATRLREALDRSPLAGDLPSDFAPQVDPAQNRQFGDYQSNAAMILAKDLRRNPREVADELVAAIAGDGDTPDWIS